MGRSTVELLLVEAKWGEQIGGHAIYRRDFIQDGPPLDRAHENGHFVDQKVDPCKLSGSLSVSFRTLSYAGVPGCAGRFYLYKSGNRSFRGCKMRTKTAIFAYQNRFAISAV